MRCQDCTSTQLAWVSDTYGLCEECLEEWILEEVVNGI